MAAYPMTMVSRVSSVTPNAGITAELADDDTLKYRRDQANVHYGFRIVHEWITRAEFDAILSFITTNGYGEHTFTLHDVDYTGTLINEPAQMDRKGALYMVEAKFIGMAV